ncbi:hypothetical protein DRE_06497 [Drechslerella stenobrocha 248]|uniref:Uncharacterized protein n=1 Tax=Drechslerella stenobrocha 248 TaxID=1043628 RepID=W7HNI8_9PEZI|nr:hypothetical protein DRE_06497 [Drechslerella stenobrocha 248]
MTSIPCNDLPILAEDYEAAKERQRYLIGQMEALDMTLWLARIPSDTKFHYPGKLHRADDDDMETEILDIMREVESLQEVVDIYEGVDDDGEEFQVDEQALQEFETMMKGRRACLTFPIPEACLSRNPSPCSMSWAPKPAPVRSFNPFREAFYLGLEDEITDDTELMPVPGKTPLSISTIAHKSLFGDLVDYVKEWNPFDLGSAGSSRSSSMDSDSMFSLNEVASDSSVSSDSGDDCHTRKTSREGQKSGDSTIAPLAVLGKSFVGVETRSSSLSSQCPWPDYLEYELAIDEDIDDIDYDDYYEYEEMLHQSLAQNTAKYANLGSSLANQIIYTERELSRSSISTCSTSELPAQAPECKVIHIELPAYKVDYYLTFEQYDSDDEVIRTELLDSAMDLQEQFPSFESVLSTFDPSFEPASEAHPSLLGKSALAPPGILHAKASMETVDLDELPEMHEARRLRCRSSGFLNAGRIN